LLFLVVVGGGGGVVVVVVVVVVLLLLVVVVVVLLVLVLSCDMKRTLTRLSTNAHPVELVRFSKSFSPNPLLITLLESMSSGSGFPPSVFYCPLVCLPLSHRFGIAK
jgi:hypothetical protein